MSENWAPTKRRRFPIDSLLDIFHGQNGRKTEPSQSEASYIVDDYTYPQYILTISPSGIGPNPHHIPNDHRSLHELPLFTTQPRAQRGPLVNYLATACGGDQNILGDSIKHPSFRAEFKISPFDVWSGETMDQIGFTNGSKPHADYLWFKDSYSHIHVQMKKMMAHDHVS